MSQLFVYSSRPETTQLACAFQNVRRAGYGVVVRPLSERPAPNLTRKEHRRLVDERHGICQQLATIGLKLDRFENGTLRPDAGEEPGLRAERDSLQARLRGLNETIRALDAAVSSLPQAGANQRC